LGHNGNSQDGIMKDRNGTRMKLWTWRPTDGTERDGEALPSRFHVTESTSLINSPKWMKMNAMERGTQPLASWVILIRTWWWTRLFVRPHCSLASRRDLQSEKSGSLWLLQHALSQPRDAKERNDLKGKDNVDECSAWTGL